MTKAQTLKSIVKKDPKPTFGSDPSDPWATRSNMMNETALLDRYLKSRGINPQYANKDLKVAHSKTNAFKNWLQAHAREVEESITTTHTPTAKRGHELRRSTHVNQEIRTTVGHKNLHSEAVDRKDMVAMDIPLLIRVLELAREDLKSDADLHRVVEKLIKIRNKGVLTMKDYNTVANIREEYSELIEQFSEDTYHDSYAATQMPFDGGNSPAEEPSTAKRIIKDIYKKNRGLKEDMYDHEKEDKSVAGYGKNPKVTKENQKLQAAAVLSGGTTLTGQKRDTVEIDPMMKMKPGQKQKEEVR